MSRNPSAPHTLELSGYQSCRLSAQEIGSNRVCVVAEAYGGELRQFQLDYVRGEGGWVCHKRLGLSPLEVELLERSHLSVGLLRGEDYTHEGERVAVSPYEPGKTKVVGRTGLQGTRVYYRLDGVGNWILEDQGEMGALAKLLPREVAHRSDLARYFNCAAGIAFERGSRGWDEATRLTLLSAGIVPLELKVKGYDAVQARVLISNGEYELEVQALYQGKDDVKVLLEERDLPKGTHSVTVNYELCEGTWFRGRVRGSVSEGSESREMNERELATFLELVEADEVLTPSDIIACGLERLYCEQETSRSREEPLEITERDIASLFADN